MDELIKALTALVRQDSRKPETARNITVELGDAPPCVRDLADALATSMYSLELGAFHLIRSTGPVGTLEGAFEMAQDAVDDLDACLASAGPGGEPFDVARTMQLGPDRGGMSALGVYWADGDAHLVIVEMSDPTEDNLVTLMSSPEDVFAVLDRQARSLGRKHLDELRATLAGA
ncbi:MAG: hypothetical protein H6709_18225 [Kofleriaceae bacterium]|nr:hypothetical protein [Myxococcales bacterium]MCB9559339.1 hypothetical protein [Kofleriaceae bacterium]MCB9574023.1 hypothetical protein [Kofleriaceae bacterium]